MSIVCPGLIEFEDLSKSSASGFCLKTKAFEGG